MNTTTANMSEPNFKNRTLWTSDNLDIMRGMNSGSVDLIYLDTWSLDDVKREWVEDIEADILVSLPSPKVRITLLYPPCTDQCRFAGWEVSEAPGNLRHVFLPPVWRPQIPAMEIRPKILILVPRN